MCDMKQTQLLLLIAIPGSLVFLEYAQVCPKPFPAHLLVTAGPGLTNTVTAVKNAQVAQTPMVILGGATSDLLKGNIFFMITFNQNYLTELKTFSGVLPITGD